MLCEAIVIIYRSSASIHFISTQIVASHFLNSININFGRKTVLCVRAKQVIPVFVRIPNVTQLINVYLVQGGAAGVQDSQSCTTIFANR